MYYVLSFMLIPSPLFVIVLCVVVVDHHITHKTITNIQFKTS